MYYIIIITVVALIDYNKITLNLKFWSSIFKVQKSVVLSFWNIVLQYDKRSYLVLFLRHSLSV